MKLERKYEELIKLRLEIDKQLQDLNFFKIKELILWLLKSKSFQNLKKWENQMSMLDVFCDIWIEEKKKLPQLGIENDIFYGVHCLKEVENKYHLITCGMLRLETIMPEKYYTQVIDAVVENRVSGIALEKIIVRETMKWEKNIIMLARLLKQRGQIITAIILLEEAEKEFPENEDILLERADCWMNGQQWDSAYKCLKKIKNLNVTAQKLMEELENKLSYENL